jgi:hypothetical protein
MQKVDLIVDGVLKLKGQRSDSAAVQKRITASYQRAGAQIEVRPSAPAPIPPPHPNPAPSVFSGRGAFTTTNPASAAGLHAQWTAIQVDPEGADGPVPGQKMWWQSRPTLERMQEANAAGIPYIAEVESLAAFKTVLALFDANPIHVPHAFVGLVDHEWPADFRTKAVAQGWELLLEWYWVNNPTYDAPNADGYPLFRNVVFGTFDSETVPGRRVYVDEHRAVWHGPFSVWDTESMTERDRAGYNVP